MYKRTFIYRHITEPTRVRGTNLPSRLDRAFTFSNLELKVSINEIRDSDHVILDEVPKARKEEEQVVKL